MRMKFEFTEKERNQVNACESRDIEDLCSCIDCSDDLHCEFCPLNELTPEQFVEFVNKNTKKSRKKK